MVNFLLLIARLRPFETLLSGCFRAVFGNALYFCCIFSGRSEFEVVLDAQLHHRSREASGRRVNSRHRRLFFIPQSKSAVARFGMGEKAWGRRGVRRSVGSTSRPPLPQGERETAVSAQ